MSEIDTALEPVSDSSNSILNANNIAVAAVTATAVVGVIYVYRKFKKAQTEIATAAGEIVTMLADDPSTK